MNSNEIMIELKAQASEKYKANVVKMGILEEYSIGVSTSIIRAFAKKIGKSNELAFELWNTGYHEARKRLISTKTKMGSTTTKE